MAKSTATSRPGDLKALLALLRASGVRRYKTADIELELDPPASMMGYRDLPDELAPTAARRGKKAKAAEARPARRRTVMDEPDLYPDGEVPTFEGREELDS